MKPAFPAEFLSRIDKGRVAAVGVPSPAASLADLEDYADQELPAARVVGLRLVKIPGHDQLISACVRSLAAAAVAVWPDWYGAQVDVGRKGSRPPTVSALWTNKAETLASAGRPPLPASYPNAVQVAQLAMALGAPELIIALPLTDISPVSEQLRSVVATATWLAELSQAKVALLVPKSVFASDEFDQVTKESIAADLQVTPLLELSMEEIPSVTVSSINGRPNPTSPGEVLLAERLGKNIELAGFFHFNQTIRSIHDKEYKVDLVWPDGRLVVEVDGYTFHSRPFAFGQDRHRDYELMITGYRVLRLTHEEIIKDTIRAIAKIGDLVRFINKNQPHVG